MTFCDDNDHVRCGDCGWYGLGKDLDDIEDLEQRIYAGEAVPAGECPMCGALAHTNDKRWPEEAAA